MKKNCKDRCISHSFYGIAYNFCPMCGNKIEAKKAEEATHKKTPPKRCNHNCKPTGDGRCPLCGGDRTLQKDKEVTHDEYPLTPEMCGLHDFARTATGQICVRCGYDHKRTDLAPKKPKKRK